MGDIWDVERLPIGPGLTKKHGRLDVNVADPRWRDPSLAAPAAHAYTHADGGSDEVTLAQSQVTDLVSDLAAKVPGTRTITATSPITGGGDLSTNRSIGIQDASTSQKGAVQLEDSTSSTSTTKAATPNSVKTAYDLANAAVPKSLADAKGDLFAATGDNAVARLAVGANDTVLTADSSQPSGVKWASVLPAYTLPDDARKVLGLADDGSLVWVGSTGLEFPFTYNSLETYDSVSTYDEEFLP